MTRILLIENDPLEGILHTAALAKRFPSIERVADAATALCRLEHDQSGEFGLVICGRPQPGFGGPAFVRELRHRRPLLPVLVLGNEAEDSADYEREGASFLPLERSREDLALLAASLLG